MYNLAMLGKKTLSFALIIMEVRAASFLLIALFGFLGYVPEPIEAEEWSYEDEKAWVSQFQDCKGSQQSPINIISKSALRNKTFPALKFCKGYEENPMNVSLVNNGHTAQLTPSKISNITGGAMGNETFQMAQLHFHWGKNDSYGAEHTLDCRKHSMEVHFVHYNTKYNSLSEALGNVNGVAVLAVWLDAKAEYMDNAAYKPITDILKKVEDKDDRYNFTMKQNLMALLPKNLKSFFTYNGSLTTPPCTQNITWTILTEILKISHSQLDAFRALEEEPKSAPVHHHLDQNNREVQAVNDRQIYLSDPPNPAFPSSLCPK